MGTQNILSGKRKKTNRKKIKEIKKVSFECDIAWCFVTGCINLFRFKAVSLIFDLLRQACSNTSCGCFNWVASLSYSSNCF